MIKFVVSIFSILTSASIKEEIINFISLTCLRSSDYYLKSESLRTFIIQFFDFAWSFSISSEYKMKLFVLFALIAVVSLSSKSRLWTLEVNKLFIFNRLMLTSKYQVEMIYIKFVINAKLSWAFLTKRLNNSRNGNSLTTNLLATLNVFSNIWISTMLMDSS